MRKDVDRFVRNCLSCRRTKATRHAPYGTLRPLPVPAWRWQHISVDFVTGLPPSTGYDAICVFVDRLTKQRHLLPYTMTINAEGLADLFFDRAFRYHHLHPTRQLSVLEALPSQPPRMPQSDSITDANAEDKTLDTVIPPADLAPERQHLGNPESLSPPAGSTVVRVTSGVCAFLSYCVCRIHAKTDKVGVTR